MNKKYNVITGIIIALLIIGSFAGIIIFFMFDTQPKDFEYLKNYDINEYMPVYISEEKMATMYYNEFQYYLNHDLKGAYELLNPDYKKKRFPSLMTFQAYILPFYNAALDSYSIVAKNDKKIFYLKMSDGNEVIFATSGVMKYEIYFDDTTIL